MKKGIVWIKDSLGWLPDPIEYETITINQFGQMVFFVGEEIIYIASADSNFKKSKNQ